MEHQQQEEYLKKIVENTSLRPSFQAVLTGTGSRLETTFTPPISLPAGCLCELALVSLETFYTFGNIDKSNNMFKVFFSGVWYTCEVPPGCYELEDINKEIQRQIVAKGGSSDTVKLEANFNTLKSVMTLGNGVKVDMAVDNSLRTVLGFDAKIYEKGRHESEKPVNIMKINSILVHNNLISSSYLNGSSQPVVYSFFPNVAPGYKIVEKPSNIIYLPVSADIIYQMTSWLTDQDNNPIDLRGEVLTIKFHLRVC